VYVIRKLLINFFNKQRGPSSLRSIYRRVVLTKRCVCDIFESLRICVWFWLLYRRKLLINFFNKQRGPSSLRSIYRRVVLTKSVIFFESLRICVWFWLLYRRKLLINFFNKQRGPSSLRSIYRRVVLTKKYVGDFFRLSVDMRVTLLFVVIILDN